MSGRARFISRRGLCGDSLRRLRRRGLQPFTAHGPSPRPPRLRVHFSPSRAHRIACASGRSAASARGTLLNRRRARRLSEPAPGSMPGGDVDASDGWFPLLTFAFGIPRRPGNHDTWRRPVMGMSGAEVTASAVGHDPTTTIVALALAWVLRLLRFLRLDLVHREGSQAVQRSGASQHAGWRSGRSGWLASVADRRR